MTSGAVAARDVGADGGSFRGAGGALGISLLRHEIAPLAARRIGSSF
jgi:hypothetical protein